LVSGHLEVLKGDKKIAEITEPGALFGELSFLLGAKRTATIQAENEVRVLRIPRNEVSTFLKEFPSVAEKITEIIARRLDESSQAVYGLKQICDKLPDAVMLTDGSGRVVAWNAAAEKLYGRDWHHMRGTSAEDIYEEPQVYRDLLQEIQAKTSVPERVLKARHPEKGTRYVSTSTTLLHDSQNNIQSILWLGRDVTATYRLERRYRRARYWLIPSAVLIVLLAAAMIFGYPYFSKGVQTMDARKLELRNLLAKDYLLLKSLLTEPLARGDRAGTTPVMKEFFDLQVTKRCPYNGIILLDRQRRVFDAYSIKPGFNAQAMIGTPYTGIAFQGSEKSLYRVLVLYRTDKDNPMGRKGIEIAFDLKESEQTIGWLLFQMDMDCMKASYDVNDEEVLKDLQS
ncbi:MAG: PAS domain-containing protein, partial [Desulfobacterota bacterium]|nr:PAS domain-containing protein [Thermodesulfobacteriota bacterium]